MTVATDEIYEKYLQKAITEINALGDEVAHLCPPDALGAVTVKSLAPFAHAGNPPLRTSPPPGEGLSACPATR